MATDPKKYKLNHSMMRIKDPKRTIEFYEFLGMKVINKLENPDNKFDLIFLGYDSPGAASAGKHWTDREGLIELTHNYGSENDDSFTVNNGNKEPHRGFGHVAITVDHIQAVCQKLEDAGYTFQKKLSDGRMHHIAFALDPDGYWVEILARNNNASETEGITTTDNTTYRMNHTMLRVKDQEKSMAFYKDVMGMNLIRIRENPDNGFNLIFFGYSEPPPDPRNASTVGYDREGLLELTFNYGTEKKADFKYHNGNDEPQGFGHIAITVDDLDAACARFEEKGVSWKKRLTDGRMKNIAFVLDPDGYWIEVLQNEKLKPRANW